MERSTQGLIDDGILFTDPHAEKDCEACKNPIRAVPAFNWSETVPGYYMFDVCQCFTKSADRVLAANEPQLAFRHVVFVCGIPCRITDDEKIEYIEKFKRGAKAAFIRDYVFDRVYPMLTTEEYEKYRQREH